MTCYRSKRTRADMIKDVELKHVKKLTSPESFSSPKTTSGAIDERWGPFRPPLNLVSQCASKKDTSSFTTKVPQMKLRILQQIKSGQDSSIQKASQHNFEIPQSFQANTSNLVKDPKFQPSKSCNLASKVDETQGLGVKKSCSIWKSIPTEPLGKQKHSVLRRTPELNEITSSVAYVSIAYTPRPLLSSNSSGQAGVARGPSIKTTLRCSDSAHPLVKITDRPTESAYNQGTSLTTTDPMVSSTLRHTPVLNELMSKAARGSIVMTPRQSSSSNNSGPSGVARHPSTKTTLRSFDREHPLVKTTEHPESARNPVTSLTTSDPVSSPILQVSRESFKENVLKSTGLNKKSDKLAKSVQVMKKDEIMPPSPRNVCFGLGNEELSSNVSKPFKPRRLDLMPNWPDDVKFDEKEEVLTIDIKGKYKSITTSIQPHDVWHSNGVKFFVTFNEFYQPLRRGGHILIKFIGDVAKIESLCLIRETNWRRVNDQYKVDIIKIIRTHFVIPDGDCYDQAILKRTCKSLRQYRHHLKELLFKPATKTKAQMYDSGHVGHPRASWIYLVDYWSFSKGHDLAKYGKEARASQNHTYITRSTSYANLRANFEEENQREPSQFEFFGITYQRKDGTFAKETLTEGLLDDVDVAVQTKIDCNPSVTMSRVELENEAFNKIMYDNELPERHVGFGFGVNRSDIFGVRGLLRKGRVSAENETLALQNMKRLWLI